LRSSVEMRIYMPIYYSTCVPWKVLLFVDTNIRGFYKTQWYMGSSFKHYRQQSMGQLHFLGFLFSWLNWTMKSAKMRTSRLIMIGQYMWPSICWNGWPNYKSGHGNRFVFTNNRSGISFQSLTPKWLAMDALWQQRKSKLVNNEFTVTRMRQTNNSVWNKNLFYRPSSPLREIIDINKILINVLK
jgi:hypothetical protein